MRRRLIVGIVSLGAILVIGGLGYFAIPQPLLADARSALASTPEVAFSREDDRYVFEPISTAATTGLVLYPGGKVDPVAYAPTARHLAELGYLVEIIPMPANLAVLGIDRAGPAIAAHPEIQHWALGGHSLGGSMAAQYLASHPGSAQGLVLWASYSAVTLQVGEPSMRSLLVYGSLDAGVASYTSPEHLSNLGAPPRIVVIEGGNHEQMGWYTGQPNDPPAEISREEQQRQVIVATAAFLDSLGP
ncbi:MAG: alpha/beta hydrolase [Chloroflexota bacterium]